MKITSLSMMLLSLALLGSACKAASNQDPLDNTLPRLGTEIKSIPTSATKSANCHVEVGFIDCEYKTPDGLFVTVYVDLVTRKEIRRGSYTGTVYPLGLSSNFGIEDARKQLKAHRIIFSESKEGDETLIVVPATAVPNDSYQFFIIFDKRLEWKTIGFTTGE